MPRLCGAYQIVMEVRTILTTPILNRIAVFDATEDERFAFQVTGGNQVVRNNLVINRVSDGAEMYDRVLDAFNLYHTVSANTLINGIDYRAKIRTQDSQGNWSAFSPSVIFWCFSEPEIKILNIDYENQNRVYNETINFEASYYQKEMEKMQSYKYRVYDSNKILIQSFDEIFSDGKELLTQEIAGLKNGEMYFVEVVTLSQNEKQQSSGLINFEPFYYTPKVSAVVTAEPIEEEGAIKISANIVQIIMELFDNLGNKIPYDLIDYVDGTTLNLNRWDYQKLSIEKGFNILNSNFIMKMWVKNITNTTTVMRMTDGKGTLEMSKRSNRMMMYKSMEGISIRDYYASEPYFASVDQDLLVTIRQENDVMDIKVEPL